VFFWRPGVFLNLASTSRAYNSVPPNKSIYLSSDIGTVCSRFDLVCRSYKSVTRDLCSKQIYSICKENALKLNAFSFQESWLIFDKTCVFVLLEFFVMAFFCKF